MALIQTASDVTKILSIEEVSVVGLLLLIIVYLAWQLEKTKKKTDSTEVEKILKLQIEGLQSKNSELDKKIEEIVKEHIKDLKEGNKDLVHLATRYHTFVEQLDRARKNV